MSKRKKIQSGSEMFKYLGNPDEVPSQSRIQVFVRDSGGWPQSTTKQNIEFNLTYGIHKTYIEGWWKETCENAKFLQCTWRTWYHLWHGNVSWPSSLMASHLSTSLDPPGYILLCYGLGSNGSCHMKPSLANSYRINRQYLTWKNFQTPYCVQVLTMVPHSHLLSITHSLYGN